MVIWINVEDCLETALVESFKEVDEVVIGHSGFHAVQKVGQNYSFVSFHFVVLSDVIAFPDSLV